MKATKYGTPCQHTSVSLPGAQMAFFASLEAEAQKCGWHFNRNEFIVKAVRREIARIKKT